MALGEGGGMHPTRVPAPLPLPPFLDLSRLSSFLQYTWRTPDENLSSSVTEFIIWVSHFVDQLIAQIKPLFLRSFVEIKSVSICLIVRSQNAITIRSDEITLSGLVYKSSVY